MLAHGHGGVAKWPRQWSAKPLFISSTLIAASIDSSRVADLAVCNPFFVPKESLYSIKIARMQTQKGRNEIAPAL
jgi:hypothetical protein